MRPTAEPTRSLKGKCQEIVTADARHIKPPGPFWQAQSVCPG
jgi:hypothetical protein